MPAMPLRLFRPFLRFLLLLERAQQFYSRHQYTRIVLLVALNTYTALTNTSTGSPSTSDSNSKPAVETDPSPFTTSLKILIYVLFTSLLVPRSLLIYFSVPTLITLFYRVIFSLHESELSAFIVTGLWAATIAGWARSRRVEEYGKLGVRGLVIEKARRDYAPRLEEVWRKHEVGMRKFCGAIAGAGGIGDGLWRDGPTFGLVVKEPEEKERSNEIEDMVGEDSTMSGNSRCNQTETRVWKGLLWALVSTQSETVKVFVDNAREIVSMEKEVLCDIFSNTPDSKPSFFPASPAAAIPPSGSARDIDDGLTDDEEIPEECVSEDDEHLSDEMKRFKQQQNDFHGLRSEKGVKLLELTERVGKVWARLERDAKSVNAGDEMATWVWRDLMWLSEVDKNGVGALESTLDLDMEEDWDAEV